MIKHQANKTLVTLGIITVFNCVAMFQPVTQTGFVFNTVKTVYAEETPATTSVVDNGKVANKVINVTIDGKAVSFTEQQPVIVGERTLVPLRGVFENMGFSVEWNDATNSATLKKGNTNIVVTKNSNTMIVSDKGNVKLDTTAQIMNEKIMIPLRAVAEASGATVEWDPATNTAIITTKPVAVGPTVAKSIKIFKDGIEMDTTKYPPKQIDGVICFDSINLGYSNNFSGNNGYQILNLTSGRNIKFVNNSHSMLDRKYHTSDPDSDFDMVEVFKASIPLSFTEEELDGYTEIRGYVPIDVVKFMSKSVDSSYKDELVEWDDVNGVLYLGSKTPPSKPFVSNPTNSGAWLPTDGLSIPGVSTPLKLGMTKSQIDAILGLSVDMGDGYWGYQNNTVGVRIKNRYVNSITAAVPGTQAFGLKVGDPYPVMNESDAINNFPSQCEPWYIAPSPTYASTLGSYFGIGDNRLHITYPDGRKSDSVYLEYSPKDSTFGKQEKIVAIQIRCN